jgi:hypothetical protein
MAVTWRWQRDGIVAERNDPYEAAASRWPDRERSRGVPARRWLPRPGGMACHRGAEVRPL